MQERNELRKSKDNFDIASFYKALDIKRHKMGISWKKISDLTEVSPSTLTRMGQGKKPDVDGLVSLAGWANLDLSSFYMPHINRTNSRESLSEIRALLKADIKLQKPDVEMLDVLITAAYNQMSK